MLVLAIAKNLDELLENGSLAAITSLSKSGGIVVVAVYVAVVFVVAVLGAEYGIAHGAGEVVDVIFAVQSRYV